MSKSQYQPGKYIFTNRNGAKTLVTVKKSGKAVVVRDDDGGIAPLGCTLDQLKRDGDTVEIAKPFMRWMYCRGCRNYQIHDHAFCVRCHGIVI